MTDAILLAILGLGVGTVYAGVGLGVVTTYKGTGLVNLAQAAYGLWASFVFYTLRTSGRLVLPIGTVDLGGAPPTGVCVAGAVLCAAALAVATHILIFRPLRRAPNLARIVASTGMLTALGGLVVVRFGTQSLVPPAVLPSHVAIVHGLAIPLDRPLSAAIAVVAGAVLWAYFRFTAIGLATRAASEEETAVALARWSPDVLACSSWALGAAVTALLMILGLPAIGLDPAAAGLLVVPGLAVALIGRFTSVGVTCAAALALGVFQSELTYLTSKPWWPSWGASGVSELLPFVVVVMALFVLGSRLPRRGEALEARLPRVPRDPLRLRQILGGTVVGVLALVLTSGSYRFGLITSMILAIISLSFVVVVGYSGQVSLAQAAVAGVGGFALAKIGSSLPFPVGLVAAALAAAVAGLAVGVSALRIRGAQLAIVTLAGALALEYFVFRNPSFANLAGNPVPPPSLLGLDLGVRGGDSVARLGFGLLTLVCLVAACLLVANVARSAVGRRLLAVRSDERAAAAAGVDVARTKLFAFALSSFLAGLAGALLGYSRGQLTADSFTFAVGISLLAFTYIGGVTSITGALVGGMLGPLGILYVATNDLMNLGKWYALIGGLGLAVNAIFNPDGIAANPFWSKAADRMRRRAPRRGDVRARAAHASDALPAPARLPARSGRADEPLLTVSGMTVTYGGVTAVDDVSLEIRPGEVVGLVGPNGAGKTSLIEALTGFVPMTGDVRLGATPIAGLAPHVIARLGVARTWQAPATFDELTVEETLALAAERVSLRRLGRELALPRVLDPSVGAPALALLGIETLRERRPSELAVGEQKLVDLARALVPAPRLLLADEPSSGLDTRQARDMGQRLARVARSHGIGVLLVEHNLGLVSDICDRLLVLDFGRLIAVGPPDEVLSDPDVTAAYLGRSSVPRAVHPTTVATP
jgi:ABC-type branched-subunit amino acid transport system ATPase component/ABC-type branched-subunit amino acid transport system permease subunit